MNEPITLGTRASLLALTQTESMANALRRAWPGLEVRVEKIRTTGDRDQTASLAFAPAGLGVGVFVKELEQALLDGRIDLAVHSMKDVPTCVPEDLDAEVAVPARADPHDCLLSLAGHTLENLPRGATVGTSSPRRRAMLRAARPDLVFTELRGNVETRLAKLAAGRCDATVLARAGLARLGLADARAQTLPHAAMLPAAGQGALALEFRAADERTRELAMRLDDAASRQAVTAERALMRRLGAGCRTPIGVLGRVDASGGLVLEAWLLSPAGDRSLRRRAEGRAEDELRVGVRLADTLLADGAADWHR